MTLIASLSSFISKIKLGYAFIQAVAEASESQIVEVHRGRSPPIKVDTGLPDLGAKRLFGGIVAPSDFWLVLCAWSFGLLLALRGFQALLAIYSSMKPLGKIASVTTFSTFSYLVLYGALLSLRWVWAAYERSKAPLSPKDGELAQELQHRNIDLPSARELTPHLTYSQLATLIVQLRHEAAEHTVARSLQ